MTSPSEAEFRQHSENVARRFLQTIVVVDDRAYFEWPESFSAPTIPLQSPIRPSFTGAEETNIGGEESNITDEAINKSLPETAEPVVERAKNDKETDADRAHVLDAKYLIESFAEKGIACAVIRPEKFEVAQLDKKVSPVAARADIVMLDWVLHQDTEGKKISEIIAEMTKKAIEQHRLRLIVVYTGELRIYRIVENIEAALKKAGVNDATREGDFTLVSGPVRILVYIKSNVSAAHINDNLKERLVPTVELPDKLIGEFTKMTGGIVSNVALDALAALRSNTHRILLKFNSDMDAPFLAHRAMLPHPEDASDLLIHLIGNELTDVLEGNEVGKAADKSDGIDVIRAWIDMNAAGGYDFAKRFEVKDSPEVLEQLDTLLRKGVANDTLQSNFKNFKKKPHKSELTKRLCSSSKSASDLEHEFAVLTIMKSDYRSELNSPSLFPGTLLKEILQPSASVLSPRYWVCIQPVCDCVRLKATRSFPLLELEPVDDNSKFDLILPDKDKKFVRVRIIYRPYRSRLEDFDPSGDGSEMVRAGRQDAENYFTANDGTRYQWLAELKFEPTQRIVNKYAAELARVGLNESEWLRLSAKGKGEDE